MSNRRRSSEGGGGSAKNHGGGVRYHYLDLSFEGRQQASAGVLNNGFRPHGGYRGRHDHSLVLDCWQLVFVE